MRKLKTHIAQPFEDSLERSQKFLNDHIEKLITFEESKELTWQNPVEGPLITNRQTNLQKSLSIFDLVDTPNKTLNKLISVFGILAEELKVLTDRVLNYSIFQALFSIFFCYGNCLFQIICFGPRNTSNTA